LTVYLSDDPDVSENIVEVARIRPPASGPGAIGSGAFGTFHGRFPRGTLNFTRGSYVELRLTGSTAIGGPNPRVWIDNWDPVVCGSCCGNFSGGVCGIDELDYLYLLSEYGSGASDFNNCADSLNPDNYVDMSDLLTWGSKFHYVDPAHTPPSLCDNAVYGGASGSVSAVSTTDLSAVIAGKPEGGSGALTQNDALFSINVSTHAVSVPFAPPVQNYGKYAGHGKLSVDTLGAVHQIHSRGLIRLADGSIRIAPHVVSSISSGVFLNPPNPFSGTTLTVGVNATDGYPLIDAAFDPIDPSIVYVVPVQVDPPFNDPDPGCPYRAAAKLKMTGGGNFTVQKVYGANPYATSSVTSSGEDCSDYAYNPDASRMRGLEVDSYGNLFINSAQGVGNQNYILIYPANGGAEVRVSISANVQASTALYVSGSKLYVSTSLDGADTTNTSIWRYSIDRDGSNNATGITLDTPASPFAISGMRFITDICANPADGTLWVLGYNANTCSREQCLTESACTGACSYSAGDSLFTIPRLAIVSSPAGTPPGTPSVSTLNGGSLALPLSLVFTSGCGRKGDQDGNGLVTTSDIPAFVTNLITNTTDPTLRCRTDMNSDNNLDGRDIALFKSNLLLQ
jgi:hypothetical protein